MQKFVNQAQFEMDVAKIRETPKVVPKAAVGSKADEKPKPKAEEKPKPKPSAPRNVSGVKPPVFSIFNNSALAAIESSMIRKPKPKPKPEPKPEPSADRSAPRNVSGVKPPIESSIIRKPRAAVSAPPTRGPVPLDAGVKRRGVSEVREVDTGVKDDITDLPLQSQTDIFETFQPSFKQPFEYMSQRTYRPIQGLEIECGNIEDKFQKQKCMEIKGMIERKKNMLF
jgi:hypothetical protein